MVRLFPNLMSLPANVKVSRHPLIAHKLSLLRSRDKPSKDVRELLREISLMIMCEASVDLPLTEAGVQQGPLSEFTGTKLADKVALVPVLRSGLAMSDGKQVD
jgi:uracil phosphoribosyltransferase